MFLLIFMQSVTVQKTEDCPTSGESWSTSKLPLEIARGTLTDYRDDVMRFTLERLKRSIAIARASVTLFTIVPSAIICIIGSSGL